ncbi:MAG: phosphatase [Bacteroidales bacterium]|nr:phosphatase [Bacteroidales bacterium]
MKKVTLDLHTHTVASGHAYSTLQEMAKAAAEKGLGILGITEHGPSLPGACHPLYFRNVHVIPREMYGVRLLMGVELNIIDNEGNVDFDEFFMEKTDLRSAGLHSLCYTPGTREENTASVIKVMENPWIQIITHPGDGTAELDFEQLVLASKRTGTILEINNSSLIPCRGKAASRGNNLEILRLCAQHQVPVILGSDAHISFSIADYTYLYPLLKEVGFPDGLVLNYDSDLLLSTLKKNPSGR